MVVIKAAMKLAMVKMAKMTRLARRALRTSGVNFNGLFVDSKATP